MKMKKASRKVLAMMAVTALMSGVSVVGAADLTMSGNLNMSGTGTYVTVSATGEEVAASLADQDLNVGSVTTDKYSISNIGGVALGYGRVDADIAILDNAQISNQLTVGSGVNAIAMGKGLIRANQFVGESVTTNTLRVGNGDKFNVDEDGNLVLSGDIVADGKVKATGMTVTGDVLMKNGQGESFVMTQDGMQMISADAEHGTGAVIVKDGNVTLIGGGNTQVDITSDGISTAGGKVTIDNRGVLTADTVMATNGGGIGGVNMINHTISIYDQTNTTRQFFYDGNGNLALQGDVKAGGALSAMNGNFNVNEDGLTYTTNGSVTSDLAELRVTGDGASLRYRDNGVVVTEDGVTIAGDLKMDGVLNTGDLGADSLSVADGKFRVETGGTMYSQVGKSQLQVRGDYVGMNYGPDTSIGLNEDGVTIRGDVSVEDDLRIGDKIYFGNDGSFAMGNGAFSVDPDGQLSVGYGKATINKYGVITASNMYIGDSVNENNRVVTKGELGQAVTEATEGAVKWDKDDSGNYTNSINGVGLEDGNVTADTVTTTGDVNVGGDLNVDGSLTVGGETVATGADVSGIKGQIGVNEDGGYKTINNGASDVITGINNNTTAINEVKTTVGSGKLDNGAADLTSGITRIRRLLLRTARPSTPSDIAYPTWAMKSTASVRFPQPWPVSIRSITMARVRSSRFLRLWVPMMARRQRLSAVSITSTATSCCPWAAQRPSKAIRRRLPISA